MLKAVILAAGLGTRLSPLTDNKPKHMLPVGGEPLIVHLLRTVEKCGLVDVTLVLNKKDKVTERFIEDNKRLNLNIKYTVQNKPEGTASALKAAEKFIDEEFLLLYGDLLLTENAVKTVINEFYKRCEAVLAVVPVSDVRRYGSVKVKDDKLISIVEKPPSRVGGLANAGVYVLTKDIFNAIKETSKSPRGEYEITDSINAVVKRGETVRIVKLSISDWIDIGRPWDLIDANARVLKNIKTKILGEVSKDAVIIGNVFISESAEVTYGSIIEGPAFIGENSKIGPNSIIRPSTSICENVKVGNSSEIKNSIIMSYSKIPHLSYVGDSIIGEHCNLGAGTKIANLRLDDSNVTMVIKGRKVDTGRRKLGAVLGDYVKTGINVSVMPGVKIGSSSIIGPNVVVYRDIPRKTRIFLDQKLNFKPFS